LVTESEKEKKHNGQQQQRRSSRQYSSASQQDKYDKNQAGSAKDKNGQADSTSY